MSVVKKFEFSTLLGNKYCILFLIHGTFSTHLLFKASIMIPKFEILRYQQRYKRSAVFRIRDSVLFGPWIRDPGSEKLGSGIGKTRIRDNCPGSATLGTGLPMRIRIQESQINADTCESGSGKLVDTALAGGVAAFTTAITLVTIRVPYRSRYQ
jgi:hypothetical protein